MTPIAARKAKEGPGVLLSKDIKEKSIFHILSYTISSTSYRI